MKKIVKIMLVFTFAFLMLTGCSKKSNYVLTIKSAGVYTVVSSPEFKGSSSFGWQENSDGTQSALFSVGKDGEYNLVVKDEAGKEYTITIVRKDGKVDVKNDGGLSVDLKQK